MIAYVSGEVVAAGATVVVLTPGGVGYELHLTEPGLAQAPKVGEQAAFHTHLVVREDGHELFGFPTLEERRVFAALLTIPKLGPKKCLAILSMYPPDVLARIATTEDLASLTKVPGLGKKTGQQVLFELKFKLEGLATPTAMGQTMVVQSHAGAGTVLGDALAGLTNLGYSSEEAQPALAAVLDEEPDLDVSTALRKALQKLSKS